MSDTEAQKAGAAAVREMRAKPCRHDHEGVPADMRGRRMSCDECVAQAVLDTVTPTVPRVASSLDDLRVGQVVAWMDALGNVHTGTVHRTMKAGGVTQVVVRLSEHDSYQFDSQVNTYAVVILSDPPPVPVTVSREAFDRLAAPLTFPIYEPQGDSSQAALLRQVLDAARALVAEVRAQEPTP